MLEVDMYPTFLLRSILFRCLGHYYSHSSEESVMKEKENVFTKPLFVFL